jgi:hypothetical protein
MSGSSGIRGYYYQVLAALLECVEDDSWESIKIEPSTKNDKVDIEWIFADSIRAVQVKSSINNFERGNVINWIYSLVKDAHSAYEIFDLPITYTLFLIGTTDRNTDTWISDLRGGRLKIEEGNKLKEIENELQYLEIKKQSFDLQDLEPRAYIGMQEYLERNDKQAKIENIKSLCSELVNELFRFTMHGRPMTKALFLKLIDKHVNSGNYFITKQTMAVPELSLAFYEKGKVQESDKMYGIQLENSPLLHKYRDEAIKSLYEARKIKLPLPDSSVGEKPKVIINSKKEDSQTQKSFKEASKSIKEMLGSNTTISELLKGSPLLNSDYINVKLPEKEITELKELSKSILGVELTKEDFNFGNLQTKPFHIENFFGDSVNFQKGTDDEKTKYYAINNAYTNLLSYRCILDYTEYLRMCHPIPLVIKNTGAVADEEIQVTISFPKDARLITPGRMEAPFEPLIEDYITNSTVFDDLITPRRDHTVMEFEGIGFRMPVPLKYPLPYETLSYTSGDFVQHLEFLFEYDHFQEGEQDIIQYEIKALNPSRKMAFPTFLLVQSDEDFEITYAITSKHLSKRFEGRLQWIHPKNTESEF